MAEPDRAAWLDDVAAWADTGRVRLPDGQFVNTETGELEDPPDPRATWQAAAQAEYADWCARWGAALYAVPRDARPVLRGPHWRTAGYAAGPLNTPWESGFQAVADAWRAGDEAAWRAALTGLEAAFQNAGVAPPEPQ